MKMKNEYLISLIILDFPISMTLHAVNELKDDTRQTLYGRIILED